MRRWLVLLLLALIFIAMFLVVPGIFVYFAETLGFMWLGFLVAFVWDLGMFFVFARKITPFFDKKLFRLAEKHI